MTTILTLVLLPLLAQSPVPQSATPGRDRDAAAIRAHIESIFQAFIDKDRDKFVETHGLAWRGFTPWSDVTSSVHHDGLIYGLDEAILACLDAATGELKWKGGRYGYGQVMLASGHLIVITEEGEIALVRATPESHQEVVRFAAIEGSTWNHPAIVDRILLIRNMNEMAAFDLRPK